MPAVDGGAAASPAATSEGSPPRSRPSPWARAAFFAPVLAVLLALVYGPTLAYLVQQWWEEPDYSHGFIVPVLAAFMVKKRGPELAALVPRESWLGLPVLLAGLCLLLLGDLGAELFVTRSSLLVVLAGLVLLHLGPGVFRLVRLPIAYLVFMIPLPATIYYAVTLPLQHLAARAAAETLDLLGVPVLLEGNIIRLSQLSLGVAEACSGIRSLLSLVALAAAWAFLLVPPGWTRLALVASAFPIAVIGNVGRVVLTSLVAGSFGARYAEGFYHVFSGWVAFLVSLGLLALTDRLLASVSGRRPETIA